MVIIAYVFNGALLVVSIVAIIMHYRLWKEMKRSKQENGYCSKEKKNPNEKPPLL